MLLLGTDEISAGVSRLLMQFVPSFHCGPGKGGSSFFPALCQWQHELGIFAGSEGNSSFYPVCLLRCSSGQWLLGICQMLVPPLKCWWICSSKVPVCWQFSEQNPSLCGELPSGKYLGLDTVLSAALEWGLPIWCTLWIAWAGSAAKVLQQKCSGVAKSWELQGCRKQPPFMYQLRTATAGNHPSAQVVRFSIQQILEVGTQIKVLFFFP